MTYDPHANLAAWLDGGWESDNNDYEVAGCFVKPDAPGAGWGVSIGTWQQVGVRLHGFADAWDAWAFVFAATGIDPHEIYLAACADMRASRNRTGWKKWRKNPRK